MKLRGCLRFLSLTFVWKKKVEKSHVFFFMLTCSFLQRNCLVLMQFLFSRPQIPFTQNYFDSILFPNAIRKSYQRVIFRRELESVNSYQSKNTNKNLDLYNVFNVGGIFTSFHDIIWIWIDLRQYFNGLPCECVVYWPRTQWTMPSCLQSVIILL